MEWLAAPTGDGGWGVSCLRVIVQQSGVVEMQIDVLFTPADLASAQIEGRTVLVVDVLRATTTIATALAAGTPAVYAVESIEEARRLAARLGDAVLGGERGGVAPEGFDRGNSPLEYRDGSSGRPVILTTTNGTVALQRALEAGAGHVGAAALVNARAAAEWAMEQGADVAILCAGTHGRFSLDDAVTAGCIVRRARSRAREQAPLGDGARAALELWRRYRENPLEALLASRHGRELERLGFHEDLRYCAAVDALTTVPVLRNGRLEAV